MNQFLTLAYLFFIGSMGGWGLELLFRRFISNKNPERKWINPGFLTGPYVPLYGFGLCILYLLSSLDRFVQPEHLIVGRVLLFLAMAVCMTLIEYIAGILLVRVMHLKLWDYSDMPGNIQGIICPQFSAIWATLGAVYYFLVHPHILSALDWLSRNLAFSFVIGLFFGVFLVNLGQTLHIAKNIRRFAEENGIIVRYEELKANIRRSNEERKERIGFLFAFRSRVPLREHLNRYLDLRKTFDEQTFRKRIHKKSN